MRQSTFHFKSFWLAALFVGLSAGPLSADEKPLNILFCFADDWGRYASCLRDADRPSPNDVVKTPNIDRVARDGMLFRNAYVNAPSCTPCRSALLSGRYFYSTGRGAILQGAQWDAKIPSFPLLLRDAGYHIGKTYKVWSPGTPADAPFGAQKFAYQSAGNLSNNFSENVTKALADRKSLKEASTQIFDEVRKNFEAFLADRKPDKPWLYWFGPTTVHRTWIKGSGKALWGIDPDSLKGKLPKFLPDVPEVREDFADYLGEIQAFDAYVGVILKKLEDVGELERTVIVVSGDHGPPGFTHGKCNLYDFGVGVTLAIRWPGGKGGRTIDDFVNLMDVMPTFLEVGGVKIPDGVHGRSLVNVLKSGRSGQVDPARTYVVTGRERHVAAAREGNLPYGHRAIRTRDYLYIRNFKPDRWPMGDPRNIASDGKEPSQRELETNTFITFADMDASPTKAWLVAHRNDKDGKAFYDLAFAKRPGEELYDVKNDPDQIKNLADDPAYADAKRRLAEQLIKVLKETNDPRLQDAFDKPPFTDPVEKKPKKQ